MGIRALGLCLAFGWFMAVASYPLAAAVHIDRRDDRTHYRFQVDGIAFTKVQIENQEFLRARLSGVDGYEGVLYEVGRPELPVIRFYIEGEGELRIRKAKANQASPPLARLRLK